MAKKTSGKKILEILPLLGEVPDNVIAQKFDIARTTVVKIRKKHGIPPFFSFNVNWEEIDPLLGTRPDREIADAFGLSQSPLVLRRQKLGIPPFDTSRRRLDWEAIDPMLGTKSDTDIAAKFNASPLTIAKRRRGLGIPPFPRYRERNANLSISEELLQAISDLPQIKTPETKGGWCKSYFVEQVLRNALSMPADHSPEDIAAITNGHIVV